MSSLFARTVAALTTDTHGNKSTTKPMAVVAFLVVVVKFLFATMGPFPPMSGTEFGIALAAAGGILLWGDTQNKPPTGGSP